MSAVYKYEHYNKHLTDLSLSVSMPEYLSASENMPSKVLDHKSDLFSVWDKGNARDVTEGIGFVGWEGSPKRLSIGKDDRQIQVQPYMLEFEVAEHKINNEDDRRGYETQLMMKLLSNFYHDKELKIIDNLSSNLVEAETITTKWDAENSTPFEDSLEMKKNMYRQPNVLYISPDVARTLMLHEELTDMARVVGIGGEGNFIRATQEATLAEYFQVDRVIIPRAKLGRGANTELWSNLFIFAYEEPLGLATESAVGNFYWSMPGTKWAIRSWFDPKRGYGGSTVVRLESAYAHYILETENIVKALPLTV